MGADAGASSMTGLAARPGLGDRCCGDSNCWFSMVGRGCNGDGVANMDGLLSTAVVMQTLLLSQSHYVLKMIGVLMAFFFAISTSPWTAARVHGCMRLCPTSCLALPARL